MNKLAFSIGSIAAAIFLVTLFESPMTAIVSDQALIEVTGAQDPPEQLFNQSCQLIDTSAACDLANGTSGAGCSGFGAPCTYCDASAAGNTNESMMCFFMEQSGCAPSSSGADNICGDEMVGYCLWDPSLNLACTGRPGLPCGDIPQVGC
jgi:hypothetical protein